MLDRATDWISDSVRHRWRTGPDAQPLDVVGMCKPSLVSISFSVSILYKRPVSFMNFR